MFATFAATMKSSLQDLLRFVCFEIHRQTGELDDHSTIAINFLVALNSIMATTADRRVRSSRFCSSAGDLPPAQFVTCNALRQIGKAGKCARGGGSATGTTDRRESRMGKSNTRRRDHQAEYQRAHRQQQKVSRKPSRDDVARLALYLMIGEGLKDGQECKLADWCEVVTAGLVDQGFDRDATQHRLHQLIERYADGWDFQRKPHLMQHAFGSSQ
jgi:hypothetical protein